MPTELLPRCMLFFEAGNGRRWVDLASERYDKNQPLNWLAGKLLGRGAPQPSRL